MTSQNPAPDGLLDRDAIDMLVVHCSDTPDDQALGARDIQEMHLGFGWDGIGYHHVICRDGTREAGRPEYWRGAHARGANERSLSVCLIGRSSFTAEQMDSLGTLLDEWRTRYPNARILGHRDAVETDKTCPNFDVESWWRMRSLAHPADRLSVTAPAMALTASPDTHALETELLFGESVQVLERTNGFARVILETDGYEGWVSARGTLAKTRPATHRLCCAAIHVLAAPDVKSSSLMRLSMGARLAVEATDDGWHQIQLPSSDIGWIPEAAARPVNSFEDDVVSVAERFLGCPYLWGGRSAAGIDCSALVQLSLQATGIDCPRNSGDQHDWARSRRGTEIIDRRETRRGDLVFWPGHVGLCRSASTFLHANAHHHAVADEATADALLRTDAASKAEAIILRLAP